MSDDGLHVSDLTGNAARSPVLCLGRSKELVAKYKYDLEEGGDDLELSSEDNPFDLKVDLFGDIEDDDEAGAAGEKKKLGSKLRGRKPAGSAGIVASLRLKMYFRGGVSWE